MSESAPDIAAHSSQTFPLWPAKPPLDVGNEPADVPSISIYPPKNPDGSAMIVCPGGAYQTLAPQEGDPVAIWLASLGITALVLKYRLAPRYAYPAALLDVARAIRTVRHRASEWKIDPKRVGVLGFSAGGHLSATISTHFDQEDRAAPPYRLDDIDQKTSRPDVSVLCYPVITLDGISAHVASRKNLLGEHPTQEQLDSLSADKRVTPHTPPAFIFHTVADNGVPVENSIYYAMAMRKAGVGFEMHLFEPGKHGVGLAQDDAVLKAWPGLCATWLAGKKFGTM